MLMSEVQCLESYCLFKTANFKSTVITPATDTSDTKTQTTKCPCRSAQIFKMEYFKVFLNIVKLKEEFCREETRIWTKNTQIYVNIS